MDILYKTRVKATGGRAGHVRSEDGLLDVPLSLPKALGGSGNATNPEQLFAAGYAACFENAVMLIAGRQGHALADDAVEVVAEVSMGAKPEGGFQLFVTLDVSISGISQADAERVVEEAHATCPYSNAVRGNIDVVLDVHAR